MPQANILLFIFFTFVELLQGSVLIGNGDRIRESRTSRDGDIFLSKPRSDGFEYLIYNKKDASGHFRREERDPNGVVKGSYGLQDPDGTTRLVRYIADEKGFRAQISSNEKGVRFQNPANVELKPYNNPLLSLLPRSSRHEDFPEQNVPDSMETEVKPSRYDLYSPVEIQKPSISSVSMIDSIPVSRQKTKSHLFDYLNVPETPPVLPFYSDMNKPYLPDYPDIVNQNISPLSKNPQYDFYQSPPDEVDDSDETEYQVPYNSLKLMKHLRQNNALSSRASETPSGIFNPLMYKPVIKVHKNLPDCNKVSSAVLCKPPYLFSRTFEYLNATERRTNNPREELPYDNIVVEQNNAERQRQIEAVFAEKLFKLAGSNDEIVPLTQSLKPFLFPPSFTYINNLNRKENFNPNDHNPHCVEKHHSLKDLLKSKYLTEELSATTSLKSPLVYNNFMYSPQIGSLVHGGWSPPLTFSYEPLAASANNNLLNDLLNDPLITAAYVNLNRYNVLKNQRNLILLTKFNNPEISQNPILAFLEKLNALGFTIAPKQEPISSEESLQSSVPVLNLGNREDTASYFNKNTFASSDQKDHKNDGAYSNKNTQALNEQKDHNNDGSYSNKNIHVSNEQSDGENISLSFNKDTFTSSGPIDHIGPEEITLHPMKEDSAETTTSSHDATDDPIPSMLYPPNDEELLHLFGPPSVPFHSDDKQTLPINDSKFVIFDELENQEDQHVQSNSTQNQSADWKKQLDDVINEEYEKTTLQRESYFSNLSQTKSNDSVETDSDKTDGRIYKIHEPPSMLFDSRGVTVKPENVPLHLHRYVPPTGITSFPWKFAIPRPAPPRSVVIPPKPLSI